MKWPMTGVLAAAMLASAAWPARAADTIRLMAYSGVFKDNYTETVVKPFEGASGTTVEYSGDGSSSGMLGQLRAQKNDPQVDVVIMDTTTAALACAEGLVEPMSAAQMPVLNELDPQARSAGGQCGPGVTFDHLVTVYDKKAVVPPPTSLKDQLDPKWKGKVALYAPPNIQGLALTAIMARADSGDWRKADGAFRELAKLAPSVQTFDPRPDGYTLILSGTVDFASGWNARAQYYADQNPGEIGVLVPTEGTVFQINTINVVKNGRNAAAARAFVAHALGAPAQKAFTERMFYGPTNTTAQIDPAASARTANAPEIKARVIPLDWDEMIKYRDAWNQRWRREVIAAGGR